MQIDQAIFTSAENRAAPGYRVVAATPGVSQAEFHELATWGPSHDSLLEHGPTATSINFHPLRSGRYCVSKTSHAGCEHSGRGGLRVYTQFLILDPPDFARFANNPFAVLRAAAAQGQIHVVDQPPAMLEPIRLAGKTPPVDFPLIAELQASVGLDRLVAFVDAALDCEQLVLVARHERAPLIAGLLNCLPVECRTAFSFTTGLKASPARAFRIWCQTEHSTETRRLCREAGLLATPRPRDQRPQERGGAASSRAVRAFCAADDVRPTLSSTWSCFLKTIFTTGRGHALASHLASAPGPPRVENLDSLAHVLLAGLEAEENHLSTNEPEEPFPRLARVPGVPQPLASNANLPALRGRETEPRRQHGITDPSLLFQQTDPATMIRSDRQAGISTRSPEKSSHSRALEALELLDDTVFAAIAGSSAALERLRQLWPSTLAKLGPEELAESREHYIRRALATWRQHGQATDNVDPTRALHAIEVVCTLFGE